MVEVKLSPKIKIKHKYLLGDVSDPVFSPLSQTLRSSADLELDLQSDEEALFIFMSPCRPPSSHQRSEVRGQQLCWSMNLISDNTKRWNTSWDPDCKSRGGLFCSSRIFFRVHEEDQFNPLDLNSLFWDLYVWIKIYFFKNSPCLHNCLLCPWRNYFSPTSKTV